VHMILMGLSFGIIFPLGMVLGVCVVLLILPDKPPSSPVRSYMLTADPLML
jgi:hypothetical protein